jgi:hypothetical protein
MSSPPPLLFDTYYHIYNRGNNRENIFIEERNYNYFLSLFLKYIDPIAELFAYCLLRNHFHWLVRIKSEEEIRADIKTLKVSSANKALSGQVHIPKQEISQSKKPLGSDYPSQQFSNFFNAYAKAINKAYNRTGSLFQHPFGRVPVTSDRQFWNVIAYIHQNPQKHKFVDDFRDWKWSSYGVFLSEKSTKLKRDFVMEWFGGRQEYLDLHKEWVSEADAKWFAQDDDD